MKIIRSVTKLRRWRSTVEGQVGFVPTMGYFHEGHVALMIRSVKDNSHTVVSLFVNPIQFGPNEDLARYPRDLERDIHMAERAGVDILFVPNIPAMYPSGAPLSFVDVNKVNQGLCGASRPGHFRGVATVVAKLLNIVEPNILYLGQKDAQQVAVIKKMIEDLNFNTRVVVCPTVREGDGLAMSSRNKYLSPAERSKAPALFHALKLARALVKSGESDANRIIIKIKKLLLDETGATIEYVSCVNPVDMLPVRRIKSDVLIALAVKFPSARLIDNTVIKFSDDKKISR